jgi:hypothetical protein
MNYDACFMYRLDSDMLDASPVQQHISQPLKFVDHEPKQYPIPNLKPKIFKVTVLKPPSPPQQIPNNSPTVSKLTETQVPITVVQLPEQLSFSNVQDKSPSANHVEMITILKPATKQKPSKKSKKKVKPTTLVPISTPSNNTDRSVHAEAAKVKFIKTKNIQRPSKPRTAYIESPVIALPIQELKAKPQTKAILSTTPPKISEPEPPINILPVHIPQPKRKRDKKVLLNNANFQFIVGGIDLVKVSDAGKI